MPPQDILQSNPLCRSDLRPLHPVRRAPAWCSEMKLNGTAPREAVDGACWPVSVVSCTATSAGDGCGKTSAVTLKILRAQTMPGHVGNESWNKDGKAGMADPAARRPPQKWAPAMMRKMNPQRCCRVRLRVYCHLCHRRQRAQRMQRQYMSRQASRYYLRPRRLVQHLIGLLEARGRRATTRTRPIRRRRSVKSRNLTQ